MKDKIIFFGIILVLIFGGGISAYGNEVDVDTVSFILNQYFCDTKQVTKESIRQRVSGMNLGLLKLTRLINNLLDFVKDMYDKFTAEGV